MTGNSANGPVEPLSSGHWWAESEPPPRAEPPTVPPEPEVRLGELWRAHQQRRAILSPFPSAATDPYLAKLAFALTALAAGLFGWFGGMKAALDGRVWLTLLITPMVVGIVLLLLWRRVKGRTLRAVLMYVGRALFWATLLTALFSFGMWSWLHAAL
jgi:hypothetical protein